MVLHSAILPKKCFVIIFGMSKYVPLCSKQNKIMYNHADCRGFHALWGNFLAVVYKKNEFPKKIFFKGSNNG